MNYDDWKLMTPEEDAEFRNPRRRAEKDPDDARDEAFDRKNDNFERVLDLPD